PGCASDSANPSKVRAVLLVSMTWPLSSVTTIPSLISSKRPLSTPPSRPPSRAIVALADSSAGDTSGDNGRGMVRSVHELGEFFQTGAQPVHADRFGQVAGHTGFEATFSVA